jgi:hypothetical protein
VIYTTWPVSEGPAGMRAALETICAQAEAAVDAGAAFLVLSDRTFGPDRCAVPPLLAVGAVHHRLVDAKKRSRVGLVVETAEVGGVKEARRTAGQEVEAQRCWRPAPCLPQNSQSPNPRRKTHSHAQIPHPPLSPPPQAREVHQFATMLGYGADAICPYLAYEALFALQAAGKLPGDLTRDQIVAKYQQSIGVGLLKVMAKMGISTLASYKGAQIFEALGIADEVGGGAWLGGGAWRRPGPAWVVLWLADPCSNPNAVSLNRHLHPPFPTKTLPGGGHVLQGHGVAHRRRRL